MRRAGDLRQDHAVHARIERVLDGDPFGRSDPRIDGEPELLAGESEPIGILLRDHAVLEIEDHRAIAQAGGDLAGRQARVFEPKAQRRACYAAQV